MDTLTGTHIDRMCEKIDGVCERMAELKSLVLHLAADLEKLRPTFCTHLGELQIDSGDTKTTARDIVALLPPAEWTVAKHLYLSECVDWVATIDGVPVRICQAETVERKPEVGTTVIL